MSKKKWTQMKLFANFEVTVNDPTLWSRTGNMKAERPETRSGIQR